jgi:hypothetical protein
MFSGFDETSGGVARGLERMSFENTTALNYQLKRVTKLKVLEMLI